MAEGPVRKGEDAVTERERECWEQFCRTGLIADYLEYRGAVDYGRRAPGEEEQDAAWDQSHRALGQELGGP